MIFFTVCFGTWRERERFLRMGVFGEASSTKSSFSSLLPSLSKRRTTPCPVFADILMAVRYLSSFTRFWIIFVGTFSLKSFLFPTKIIHISSLSFRISL